MGGATEGGEGGSSSSTDDSHHAKQAPSKGGASKAQQEETRTLTHGGRRQGGATAWSRKELPASEVARGGGGGGQQSSPGRSTSPRPVRRLSGHPQPPTPASRSASSRIIATHNLAAVPWLVLRCCSQPAPAACRTVQRSWCRSLGHRLWRQAPVSLSRAAAGSRELGRSLLNPARL